MADFGARETGRFGTGYFTRSLSAEVLLSHQVPFHVRGLVSVIDVPDGTAMILYTDFYLIADSFSTIPTWVRFFVCLFFKSLQG